jgi:hypothetical protein
MPRGGARKGAGRPPLDPSGERRQDVYFHITATEEAFLREALEYRRSQVAEQIESDPKIGRPPKQ